MRWCAEITYVKAIASGDTVSYGRTFTAGQPVLAATVSVGYADGYPRQLSNRGVMTVRGQAAALKI